MTLSPVIVSSPCFFPAKLLVRDPVLNTLITNSYSCQEPSGYSLVSLVIVQETRAKA
jgi:hypothetical protein